MARVSICFINYGTVSGYNDLPLCLSSKESACSEGNGFDFFQSERSPGKGNGNPLQYYCLEDSTVRGAWWARVHEVARVGHDLATKLPPAQWLQQINPQMYKNPNRISFLTHVKFMVVRQVALFPSVIQRLRFLSSCGSVGPKSFSRPKENRVWKSHSLPESFGSELIHVLPAHIPQAKTICMVTPGSEDV